MADNRPDIDVVAGEMQPWSDYGGSRQPVGGPVLDALLADLLPGGTRTLVLGPHDVDLIETVAARSTEVVVLVRSVADATALEQHFGDSLSVVAGGLDGFVAAGYERFDAVVAADGLDRVLGYDSAALDWTARLDALANVVVPAAIVVLGLENEFALSALLDRRPPDQRHGDVEWRPLHDDPSRPVSTDQLAAELDWIGFPDARRYAAYSVDRTPSALISVEVVAAARPGQLPAQLAADALDASAVAVPLLAPISESARSAARAGLLGAVSTGWIAVAGGRTTHEVYAKVQGSTAVLTADKDPAGWTIAVRAGASRGEVREDVREEVREEVGEVEPSVAVIPTRVPDGSSVQTQLLRLAAAEDVPGFRALAARLGDWARAQGDSRVVLRWDDVIVADDNFAYGVSPWLTAAPRSSVELLAAAWHRFQDELVRRHHRHPWPPWMIGADLVTAWLAMSGVEADAEQVARGRALATALATATEHPPTRTPDLRTALADAERARVESSELAGHIFGLERTLSLRDKALKTRDTRLREVRGQLQEAKAAQTRLRGSRAYRVVRLLRQPRKLAGKAKRRLRNRLRRLVR